MSTATTPLPRADVVGLYVALVYRLRHDAAAALSSLGACRFPAELPVAVSQIGRRPHPSDERREFACVHADWLASYTGDACDSEIEALCSLIERAHRDIEEAGGVPPMHLLHQAEDDALVLAVYREHAARRFKAAREEHEALDAVAEASDLEVPS